MKNKIEKTSILPLIKLLGILLLSILLISIFRQNYMVNEKTNELLMAIASSTAIMVAIIVSYLFAKLFAEKEKRIQRKTVIDEFSLKITALRRIAHFIYTDHKFWNKFNNVKANCDKEDYKALTLEQFESSDAEMFSFYKKELGTDFIVQAYLGIRDLQSAEMSSFEFIRKFKLRNYNSDELIMYKECCSHFVYFINKRKSDIIPISEIENVVEQYTYITQKKVEESKLTNAIEELFEEFSSKVLQDSIYLTKLNEAKLPSEFINVTINLTLFIVLLITSLIIYAFSITESVQSAIVNIVLVLFCVNTIDLILSVLLLIKKELRINEFYKI